MVLSLIVISFLTLLYSLLIISYLVSWRKIPIGSLSTLPITTTVSVLIPSRNEMHTLPLLLDDILNQNIQANKLQVIVIDDHSTDDTLAVAQSYTAQFFEKGIAYLVLNLSHAPIKAAAYKKQAISYAIKNATGQWIVTTDADCRAQPDWLITMLKFQQATQAKLIAAPVKYSFNHTFFQQFQALDFIGLIGITGASIQQGIYNMCNGANLGYSKVAFDQVGGFIGNDNLSSGDDMFLMHKIAQLYPQGIFFLKNNTACIETIPKTTLKEFLFQRMRWTSKSTSYSDKRITAILVMAYLFNIGLIFGALVYSIYLLLYGFTWAIALLAIVPWLVKTIIDYIFLREMCLFFNQRSLTKWYLIIQPIHILYIVLVGLLGQVGTFEWKDRTMKK
jgi:biofilm PGA synthesis N-glycosyltransferase PgaC